jgi:rhodanese-related sulfurtransferase
MFGRYTTGPHGCVVYHTHYPTSSFSQTSFLDFSRIKHIQLRQRFDRIEPCSVLNHYLPAAISVSAPEKRMSKSQRNRSKTSASKSRKPSKTSKTASRKWIYITVSAVVVILIGAFLYTQLIHPASSSGNSSPLQISVKDAYAMYQEGVFFLDVRTQEEWADFHVPDSTLIPLDQLPNRLNELPRDRPIVVVCRSGNRSQQGRDILLNAGFTQVVSMTGGLNQWRDAGYPITSGP